MYLNTSLVPAGSAAGARYRTVDVAAQVEAASPHRLVGILFDELVKTIDVLRAAILDSALPGVRTVGRGRA